MHGGQVIEGPPSCLCLNPALPPLTVSPLTAALHLLPPQAPSRESILRFLEGRIARWWMPDDVAIVDEIPHTATGKISKLTLRRQFQDYKPAKARL